MSKINPLSVSNLQTFNINNKFNFDSTDDLADFEGIVGQDRAIDSLSFGMGVKRPGYNMYLMGSAGLGKHSLLKRFLDAETDKTNSQPVYDWCYVYNFNNPQQPKAIKLAAGQGKLFKETMAQLAIDLETAIPNAFETEQYHNRLHEVREDMREKTQKAFQDLSEEARKHNVLIVRRGEDLTFLPVKDDKTLKPEEYDDLSEKERLQFDEVIAVLEERIQNIFRQRSQWQKEAREAIKNINREVGTFATAHLIHDVRERYQSSAEVSDFLNAIQEDVIQNLHEFRIQDQNMDVDASPFSFGHYEVNLIVDNSETKNVPVIYEDNPLYQALVGQVEYVSQMGTLVTDYQLIKAGALHKANGGYLIIDANKLLSNPYAWDALKRTLFANEINIQSLAYIYGFANTVSLEPEPIPLDIKIALVGNRSLYYLLEEFDPEFSELFKVEVDFSESIECNDESLQDYAQLIATLVRKNNLMAFERDAVIRIMREGMRQIEDTKRISTHMRSMCDLLCEADYWANKHRQKRVTDKDVQHAIDKQIYRADRSRERIYDEIHKGTIKIDVTGSRVATVNGLFVIETGRLEFSQPARITATVRLGDGDIVDIEREVDLGGSLHSKGVLILSSYLASHYAREKPFSLAASLVFEQSYGNVDGDSATVGELCALMSAITNIPIKQSFAITGSANQLGEVQAIGGVNEKIEGFFAICHKFGLSGEQGVIIPRANVPHLILRDEVIKAVAEKQFYIYAIDTVDEAIALLTGLPAGERDKQGNFPEGSVNHAVETRLIEMANLKHESDKDEHEHHESDKNENKSASKDKE